MKSFLIAKASAVIAAVGLTTSVQAASCSKKESQDIAASNGVIHAIETVVCPR